MDILFLSLAALPNAERPRSSGTRASRVLGAKSLAHHSTARRAWFRADIREALEAAGGARKLVRTRAPAVRAAGCEVAGLAPRDTGSQRDSNSNQSQSWPAPLTQVAGSRRVPYRPQQGLRLAIGRDRARLRPQH